MKRSVLFLCLIACGFNTRAQMMDSIAACFHYKPKFYIDLYSYNSVVNRQAALFTDLLLGVSFHKKIYLSAGFSGLSSNVVSEKTITDDSGSYTTNAKLNMGLFIVSTEYVFSRKYPWTFSVIPFKFGIGNAFYQYVDRQTKTITNLDTKKVILYQPQVTASYNVLKWIGFGASAGYRITIHSPLIIRKDLDSFTYSLGVKLFLDAIYDAVFPRGIFPAKKPN